MSKHSHILAIFDNDFQSQASSADVYLCEWIYYVLLEKFNHRPTWVVPSCPTRNDDRMSENKPLTDPSIVYLSCDIF